MTFDADLRRYLESLERAPIATARSQREVDEDELRQHLLGRLRELPQSRVINLYDQWSPRLAPLARYVEQLPVQVAPTDKASALNFAGRLIDAALDVLEKSIALVDRLELHRLLTEFMRGRNLHQTYALEVQLIHRDGTDDGASLTALGRTFLRLRGKDALQWLLILEIQQSQGNEDIWRVSRQFLEQGLTDDGIGEVEISLAVFSQDMVSHGIALGVLEGDIR